MNEAPRAALESWQSFYVIVGSSAGALTGLQFVVLTLISEAGATRSRGESISAFGSPNVVHFCAALLVSAIFSAPWAGLGPPGGAIAACGALGLFYSIAVLRRTLRQREYRPVLEDWIWHAMLPMLAYAALLVSGLVLPGRSFDMLYVVGGAVLLLVFIGIHNAWDTVMYVTIESAPGGRLARPPKDAAREGGGAPSAPESRRRPDPPPAAPQ
jgi:hypothetical protein